MKHRILVAGGAGYIGSHVQKQLLEDGFEVAVFDDLSSGDRKNILPGAAFIEGNILDKAALNAAMRQEIDGVVHLAHRKDTPDGRAAIAELEESITRMKALAEAPIEELWQEDLAFHRRLVVFSGNREFAQLFESCNHRMSVIAKQSFQSPNRRQAAIAEHQAILDAVRACSGRDDLTAYGALRTHMEASRDIVLREDPSR